MSEDKKLLLKLELEKVATEQAKLDVELLKQGYSFQETAKITLCSGIAIYLISHNYNEYVFYIFVASLFFSLSASTLLIIGRCKGFFFNTFLFLSNILFIVGLFLLATLSNDKVKSPSDIIKCNFAIPLEDKSYKVRGNINGKTFEIIQEPAKGTQKKN